MEITDIHLVERLKKRDPEALETVMDKYGSHVFHLVSRILRIHCRNEDIEECVSDVFISGWNKINDYDPAKGTLKTWLLILAKYKALDYRRKLCSKPDVVQIRDELPDRRETEQTVLLKEEKEEMIRIVNSFGTTDKSIFYKRYFFYESLETIADHLGLTRKAVESRLGRMRKELKQRMVPNAKEGLL